MNNYRIREGAEEWEIFFFVGGGVHWHNFTGGQFKQ